ncbi:MAG: nuclear transport factor 2 family protein [Balneolaceae bacterium]|nr:nuclear transport factor 2 family protein [Balneolaceae bacterium]
MTNLDRAYDIVKMSNEGQMMEALLKYYHEDSVKVEGTGEVTEGLEANVEFHKGWIAGIKEVHDGGIIAAAENPETGVVFMESWVDMTFQDGNRMKMQEVEVQTWEDGKIKHIRFYYDTRGME